MEVSGKIKFIDTTKEVGAKAFKKRDIVVETDEQYKQSILIQFVQDKCELLDKFSLGQEVKIGINLRGNEWVNLQGETKYFNTIQGWNINAISETKEPLQEFKEVLIDDDDKDDMPF